MDTVIPLLQKDLVDAAERAQKHRLGRRLSRRRAPVVALAATVVLAGGAAAATGLLPVGSRVPADVVRGSGEPRFVDGRMVVATGMSPRVGRWQMYYADTNRGACIALEFIDARSPLAEGCGATGSFTVGKWSVPHREIAIYGRVPADVGAVQVRLRDGTTVRAEIHAAPKSVVGNFYFAGVPYDKPPVAIQELDKNGHPTGPVTDVP